MYIIIVGCGRLGSTLAQELSDAGHDVSIIDRDGGRLAVLGSGFNGQKLKGIEFDYDILLEAGIRNADFLMAVTPDDNINITVSLIAKNIFGLKHIIARICQPAKENIYERLEIETINTTRLDVEILKGMLRKAE